MYKTIPRVNTIQKYKQEGKFLENKLSNALPMAAMDDVPEAKSDAASITGLVKKSGKVKGYQLSDGRIISREEGVALAKNGEIKGVGIAHNGDTVYLKSLPDDSESNNLSSLPTIRADKFMS